MPLARRLEWGYIPHPRHPLRPCCKHGGAPGAREGPSPILVLLSPRPKLLERSILRRGRCTARCAQGEIHGDNVTPPRAGGIAGARDRSRGIGARGKKGHSVYVRPFPERVLDSIVRRGIRLPSTLAPAQEHEALGGRETRGGGSPRGIGRLEQLNHSVGSRTMPSTWARAADSASSAVKLTGEEPMYELYAAGRRPWSRARRVIVDSA